jgi:alanine-synthesizing transaminase
VELFQSSKLSDVLYDVRGPALTRAKQLEAEGHHVLKLNIGNPAPFGFDAPDELCQDVVANLRNAQGYSDSKGVPSARRAVVQYHRGRGLEGVDVEDVYLGNGVSELIVMAMQALLDEGDEVLVPAPDYPLWTAAVSLSGGRAAFYLCDEQAGWSPDLADVERRITDRTKALVVINPNNPTGAVYDREVLEGLVEIARRRRLLILSDEIYDKILYDGAEHVSTASLAPDVLCLTFNGLSKAYLAAGFRSGWMVVSGPRAHAGSYLEGLDLLANMRLCPNVLGQYAVQAALGGRRHIDDLTLPGGRLHEQRDLAYDMVTAIPGVSCVKPRGALYLFPRLDPTVYPVSDDRQLILDLLEQEKVLLVQGTGFNWPRPDHLRIVTLPDVRTLATAIERLDRFLADVRG